MPSFPFFSPIDREFPLQVSQNGEAPEVMDWTSSRGSPVPLGEPVRVDLGWSPA